MQQVGILLRLTLFHGDIIMINWEEHSTGYRDNVWVRKPRGYESKQILAQVFLKLVQPANDVLAAAFLLGGRTGWGR